MKKKLHKFAEWLLKITTGAPAINNNKHIKGDKMAHTLEETFKKFGINGKIVNTKPGPILTTYEFEPVPGIRIDDIIAIEKSLNSESTCIFPIPRTPYIGITIPNINRQIIEIQPLLKNKEFVKSDYNLPVAIGVLTDGQPVYFDLSKMPHALIAGHKGSGKSVLLNSIMVSLISKFIPAELQFIIIDQKGVDFKPWENSKYTREYITNPKESVKSLERITEEINARFNILKQSNSDNIKDYNDKSKDKMPYLIIIIDELADLIIGNKEYFKSEFQKIFQQATATGIHLITATKRPDDNFIAEYIKGNFATRISFQAQSDTNSIITLGEPGAEKLLPFGDILFSENGRIPVRIHTPWINDNEIKTIIKG
jgi:S-DNA-T family DNA segregation ATPase FtsK/SpoIIIE